VSDCVVEDRNEPINCHSKWSLKVWWTCKYKMDYCLCLTSETVASVIGTHQCNAVSVAAGFGDCRFIVEHTTLYRHTER
jgi:hypothetical protein